MADAILSPVKVLAAAVWLAGTIFAQTSGPPARPGGEVTGGVGFRHVVDNVERSFAFYHDVIGLDVISPPQPEAPLPEIMNLGNTIGAHSRIAGLRVPGSEISVVLIDYKNIDREPAQPRFQDPGAGNLIVRVIDLDAAVARVKKSAAHILTAGGEPATVRGNRVLFLQDPDGYVVELSQANSAAGGVEVTVADLEKTAAFYRLLGFDPSPPGAWYGDKLLTDTAGTPGAQFRQSRAFVPGSSASITFIEFQDIARKPLHTRTQDPGTTILELNVRDVDGLVAKLKAGGGTVVSVGGEAVPFTKARIALVRDPDNLFLQLIDRR